MSYIEFTIEGPPRGKVNPQPRMIKGRPQLFTPHDDRKYMQRVRDACAEAMEGAPWFGVPLTGAVKIEVVAFFAIPPSWPKYKREAALNGTLRHTQKPDCSNILKLVEDGVNPPDPPKEWTGPWPPHNSGYAYADDAQSCDSRAVKRWSAGLPFTLVRITPLDKGE